MNHNKLIPEIEVTDYRKSLKFYTEILGFNIEYMRDEGQFTFISLNEAQLMIEHLSDYWATGPMERPFGRGVNFQIEAISIESLLESLEKNQHSLFRPLHEVWYRVDNKLKGHRQFLVKDPDGYLLRFYEDIGTMDDTSST